MAASFSALVAAHLGVVDVVAVDVHGGGSV